MISVPVILTFALALFLTLLFPIMLILILAWKKKISLLPLGFGFLSFLLSGAHAHSSASGFLHTGMVSKFRRPSPRCIGVAAGLYRRAV